ncbi:COG4223 family protein [Afifella pfennigii]|uniref:COG4223 family protein n=1 Tax=Afifella pfennigii TaxID=209897 RepID=UPI000554FDC9|nr:hypothetical protein [Afifella pfennigii]
MAKNPEDKGGTTSPGKRKPVTLDLKAEEVKKAQTAAAENKPDKPGASHIPEEPAKTGASASHGQAKPSGPAAEKAGADKSADKPHQEDAVKTGAASRGPDTRPSGAAKTAADEAGPADKPAGSQKAPDKAASAAQKPAGKGPEGERPAAAARDTAPPPTSAPSPKNGGAGFVSLLGAGILGAGLALGGAWAIGLVGTSGGGGGPDAAARLAALEERIGAQTATLNATQSDLRERLDALAGQVADGVPADLRQQIEGLEAYVDALSSNAAAGSGAAPAALDEVWSRLSKLEATVAAGTEPGSDVDERLQALSGEIAALRDRPGTLAPGSEGDLTALSTRLEDLAGRISAVEGAEPVDLSPLQDTIAANAASLTQLESALAGAATAAEVETLRTAIGEITERMREVQAASDRASALAPAVAAQALNTALESGRPYRSELDTAAAFGVQIPPPLEAFAEEGLPSRQALLADFRDLSGRLTEVARKPAPDASLVDRLTASARNLVEIRPAEPREGDDIIAITSRIAAALRAGAFAEALSEWQGLPEAARLASAEWASRLEARAAGEELAARLRDESLTRLNAAG